MEAWLDGHRQRVEARGEQIVLHPVITEFQELIDTDPLVRMYVNQMIAQVPATKPYSKRHLESVDQLLRLINEVLTMAPEFGPAMVATPLGAILDWTMGTPAGFAAYPRPADQRDAQEDPDRLVRVPQQPRLARMCSTTRRRAGSPPRRQRAVGIEQFEYDPQDEHWGFASWNDFFTRRFKDGARPVACAGGRQGDRERLRVNALRHQHRRAAARSLLDQESALFATGHAGQR